ncbi:hypothetical protein B0H14DRAFT_3429758 [Mycena olivaceomarginata]|nr:hypothetical protein B0H14DRAFT_3429758 [Mycena olivaceomarginata]
MAPLLQTLRDDEPNGGQTRGKLKVPHHPLGHVPHLPSTLEPKSPHRYLGHVFHLLLPLVYPHSRSVTQVQSSLGHVSPLLLPLVRPHSRTPSRGRALRDLVITVRLGGSLRSPDVFSPSPAADTSFERPAKRRRRDDDNHDAQGLGQTHAGDRKRKRDPDSPGDGDVPREPPLIAMRLGVNNQRSAIFYAKVEDVGTQHL